MENGDGGVPEFQDLPTKDKILIAAHDEFVARGYEGARMQRIAEVSGANKAMIYYYFGGKKELYLRVVGATFNVAIQSLAGIAATDQAPEEKLRSVVRFYVEFYSRNQDFLRLLMREFANRGPILDDLLGELGQAAERHGFPGGLVSMLERGVDSGEFRAADHRQTVMSMISMCAGYFMLKPVADLFLGFKADDERQGFVDSRADAVADLLLSGIAAGGKRLA